MRSTSLRSRQCDTVWPSSEMPDTTTKMTPTCPRLARSGNNGLKSVSILMHSVTPCIINAKSKCARIERFAVAPGRFAPAPIYFYMLQWRDAIRFIYLCGSAAYHIRIDSRRIQLIRIHCQHKMYRWCHDHFE